MQLDEWSQRKREELRRLGPRDVRDLTPSIRDFHHAVTTGRSALAVVVELARATPEEGTLCAAPDLPALCRAIDAASVSAVAVPLDGAACGGSSADVRQVAALTGNPVLARDLVLGREQVYQARLAGADAVLLTAAVTPAPELRALIEIAASVHMAAPVEVRSGAELAAAVAAGARAVVVPAFEGAALSLALPLALLPEVPRAVVALVRGPFGAPEELAPLRGKADGIWLCGPLMRAADPAALLGPLVEAAEDG